MGKLRDYDRAQDEASAAAVADSQDRLPPQSAPASEAAPDEQSDPFAAADAAGLDYSEGDGESRAEPALSQEQNRKLQAMCNSRFKRDRAARLSWATGVIFRTVDTFDTLTVREASRLIEALEHDEAVR
jgi:hypothetical protein